MLQLQMTPGSFLEEQNSEKELEKQQQQLSNGLESLVCLPLRLKRMNMWLLLLLLEFFSRILFLKE